MRLHNWSIDHAVQDEFALLDDGVPEYGCSQPDRWAKRPVFDKYGRPVQELDTVQEPAADAPLLHRGLPHARRRDMLMQAVKEAGLKRPALPSHKARQRKGRKV